MIEGNIFINFKPGDQPQAVSATTRAVGVGKLESWDGASDDAEWQAEQAEYLRATEKADVEALTEDA